MATNPSDILSSLGSALTSSNQTGPRTVRNKFYNKGMAFSIPLNDIPEGMYAYLQNIRITQDGVMIARPSLGEYLTLQGIDPVHSIKRINDILNASFMRVVGAGNRLYVGNAAFLSGVDTGYSGKPLTFVDFRPENAINSFCYVADENKQRKVGIDAAVSEIGIKAPNLPGVVTVDRPLHKIIDAMEDSSVGHWTGGGSATNPVAAVAIATIIDDIILDTVGGVPGFCSIVPHVTDNIHVGAIVTIGTEQNVIIEEIKRNNIPAGSSIDTILYDVGTTGLCTITPTISSYAMTKDSIVRISGAENARVLEVLPSVNGIPSFKCVTVGTFAAGQSLVGIPAFRVYAENAHVVGEAISNKSLTSTIAATGLSTLTGDIVADFASLHTRNLGPNDYVYFAISLSTQSTLVEIQFQLDIDQTTNNFTKNYLYYAITPNNLLQNQLQTQTILSAQQGVVQISQIQQSYSAAIHQLQHGYEGLGPQYALNNPEILEPVIPDIPMDSIDQTTLGADQWHTFKVPFSAFQRVGSDPNVGFKDVKKIRFSIKTTGAVDVALDSIWIGGGFEISGIREGFLDLNYVYRYKNPNTKEVSNWSPPLRNNVTSKRNRLLLASTASPNTFATYVQWARIGSSLNDWRILGEQLQTAGPFVDEYSDAIIADNEKALFDSWQPWVIIDKPKRGRCSISGTQMQITSGDLLDVRCARGTAISIDGVPNLFYNSPEKLGALVELEWSMPTMTDVEYFVPQPVLVGYPLPIMAGPFGEGVQGLIVFGTGDKINPGTFYWMDGNSGSLQNQLNFLEVTSPSEILMNIVFYNSYPFLFTNKRNFQILPNIDANGNLVFIARENVGVRGLYSRYAVCSGNYGIAYLVNDASGIDLVLGTGRAKSITDGLVHLLFSQNGEPPSSITLRNGLVLYPPNFNLVDDLRLFTVNSILYFGFINTNGQRVQMLYDHKREGWISYDIYIEGVGCTYAEESQGQYSELFGAFGRILKADLSTPLEDNLPAIVLEKCNDFGSLRAFKRFEDFFINSIAGDGYTIQPRHEYNTINGTAITKGTNTNKDGTVHSLLAYEGSDVSLEYNFILGAGVGLYEDAINATILGELLTDNTSGFDDANLPLKDKWMQGIVIEANTFGQDKTLTFITDDDLALGNIVINHTGQETKSYSFKVPKIAHAVSFSSNDGVKWIHFQHRYVFDIEPEKAKVWEGEVTIDGIPGYRLFKKLMLSYRATSPVIAQFYTDQGLALSPITFPTTNGDVYREYQWLPAIKSKTLKYRFEADEDFRIYKNQCELYIAGFNSSEGWQIKMPFGDLSNQTEITI